VTVLADGTRLDTPAESGAWVAEIEVIAVEGAKVDGHGESVRTTV